MAAAQDRLATCASLPVQNHSYRTAFWTLSFLGRQAELTPDPLETTWVPHSYTILAWTNHHGKAISTWLVSRYSGYWPEITVGAKP